MIRQLLGLIGVTCVCLTVSARAGTIGRQVRYECQIFRIAGEFRSDTSLDKNIWAGDKKAWEKIRKSVTLFDEGTFRLGSDKLEINRKGCHWNGRKLSFEEGYKMKLPEEKIKMIYSPNILTRTGELVKMDIESRQPFPYFVRREDGLFELKEVRLPVGLVVEIRAEDKGKDVFLISDLKLLLRWVSKREPIPGVNLPIGRPILQEQDYWLRLFVRESKSYGILLRPEGNSGAIIIRIEIDDS